MLRLRGIDKNGNMHQFDVTQIDGPVGDYIAVAIHSDHATHIDPATIRLVDDPRKQMLAEIREMVVGIKSKNIAYGLVLKILDELEARL